MTVNNTNPSISQLLVEPEQKKFRCLISYRHVFQRAKKPSHATVPLSNTLLKVLSNGTKGGVRKWYHSVRLDKLSCHQNIFVHFNGTPSQEKHKTISAFSQHFV